MLDISPVLLLSSGIIFLLVVARLNSCLFKPLLKHMDDRAASIKKDLEDAKSNSADVDGLLAEANDIISKAKKEAAAIREQAYKEAKDSADAKLASAKSNLEAKSAEFARNLQDETKALRDSLVSSMPQFNESLKAKLSSI
ncbi:F0F1 ATP synthase subunit B' [Arcobacter aquimarinus]|uniref:F0F1 ATP synthase subunit B family protein n=1 Tax=Arcobacter aquimarinus TaxID=1315211 RepID=UPI002A1446C5|nr:F0F1 ATP synthase subunit B' [Arcobacter sp.]MCB9207415.1 F0F1 ATP synthase subunit B' [Ignavibacteriales bacterium]